MRTMYYENIYESILHTSCSVIVKVLMNFTHVKIVYTVLTAYFNQRLYETLVAYKS